LSPSHTATEPSAAARWSIVALLAAALFINYVDRGALPIAATLVQDELGLSPRQLGLLFSAFFWSYALLQIPVGWLAERFGAQRVLAVGLALWASATMLVGFAHSFTVLLLLRLLLGVGESAGFPCVSKLLATVVPVAGLGTANGRYFTFNAGMGLDAEVVRAVEGRRAHGLAVTPARYTRTALRQFFRVTDRRHPAISITEPAGLLMTAVLHFVADDRDPWGLVARYVSALAPGSYLALSHATPDGLPPLVVHAMVDTLANATEQLFLRPRADVERFFTGMEMVPPYPGAAAELTFVGQWGAVDPASADSDGSRVLYCGVAQCR